MSIEQVNGRDRGRRKEEISTDTSIESDVKKETLKKGERKQIVFQFNHRDRLHWSRFE